ncbi:MAG: prepilin-type N-terminal cleavage/methylation domain-containing protein [Planctomycetota bacterium]|jgi:prepilin-type N-terminal cleavage/methylation domain-containing protein
MKHQPANQPAAQSAFTLVEMLAVMVILSILMAFLVSALMGASKTVEIEETRQFLSQIEAAVEMYEGDKGDYPGSTFPTGKDRGSNKVNMGIEELVVSLMSKGSQTLELPEDKLINMDGDSSRKSVTSFPAADLFELCDAWDNPIAYFHRRDYGTPQIYTSVTLKTNELLEDQVTALKNPKTGAYYNRRTFQLISSGADGIFGNDDDIGNFDSGFQAE